MGESLGARALSIRNSHVRGGQCKAHANRTGCNGATKREIARRSFLQETCGNSRQGHEKSNPYAARPSAHGPGIRCTMAGTARVASAEAELVSGSRLPATDERAKPSNRDSNKGIVSVRYEPYGAMLQLMFQLHTRAWPLAAYLDIKGTTVALRQETRIRGTRKEKGPPSSGGPALLSRFGEPWRFSRSRPCRRRRSSGRRSLRAPTRT